VEITVYRAVQEALTNIRKHAEATKVDLGLQFEDGTVSVKIHDNGRGFDLTSTIDNAVSVGNMGLLGMRQRVQMVGGKLDIRTRRNGGTTITMTLPVEQQEGGS
jgi:two-component system sensor histidine kinase DegS